MAGPYNSILTTIFSGEEDFTVFPQAYPLDSRDSIDPAIEYMIQIGNTLVMCVEVKNASDIRFTLKRALADEQIRARITSMQHITRVPVLFLVSAMGIHCCVYPRNSATRETEPQEISPTDLKTIDDTAPAEWWSIDISALESRLALMECFNEVKASCNDMH
ncbi:hypothetical protein BGX26_004744 [Mortierella sp. AD094]|nr:hypothetical protein BGX26_004744 [Mortierella sp. AD094]